MQGIKLNNKYYGVYKNTKYYSVNYQDINTPLHFIALEDNSSVGYTIKGSPVSSDFKYSYDMNTWNSWNGTAISLNKNDVVYIKGNNPNGINISSSQCVNFTMSGKIKANGNINSLLDNNNGNTITTIPAKSYVYLFYDCQSLVSAPALPVTVLSDHCYYGMFRGCSSLVVTPILPATTLASSCYGQMFYQCSSLVSASTLPATTLYDYCYDNMFTGCTSLVNAPNILATTLAQNCCSYMFYNCSSLIKAPELLATTLIKNCYSSMFSGCSSLNYIKTAFTTDFYLGNTYNFTSNWVSGVSSTGDFYYNGETIRRGTSAIPTNWTVHTF